MKFGSVKIFLYLSALQSIYTLQCTIAAKVVFQSFKDTL